MLLSMSISASSEKYFIKKPLNSSCDASSGVDNFAFNRLMALSVDLRTYSGLVSTVGLVSQIVCLACSTVAPSCLRIAALKSSYRVVVSNSNSRKAASALPANCLHTIPTQSAVGTLASSIASLKLSV